MSAKKRGLGRGLESLLSSKAAAAEPDEALNEIALGQLAPGRYQPRREFDNAELESLAASIRSQGVLQPLVVRPIGAEKYEIVAGERRWRAAKMAGLKAVPAVVRSIDDPTALAVALVENMQRADLNPLEEAVAVQRLIKECGLTHEQAATELGKSRAAVSNLLRLMDLPEEVQALVRGGKLSFGHAKVLLGAEGARLLSLAKMAAEQQLSVRQVEALIDADGARRNGKKSARHAHPMDKELSHKLGLAVRVALGSGGAGSVTIRFKDKSEFDKLVRTLR